MRPGKPLLIPPDPRQRKRDYLSDHRCFRRYAQGPRTLHFGRGIRSLNVCGRRVIIFIECFMCVMCALVINWNDSRSNYLIVLWFLHLCCTNVMLTLLFCCSKGEHMLNLSSIIKLSNIVINNRYYVRSITYILHFLNCLTIWAVANTVIQKYYCIFLCITLKNINKTLNIQKQH